MKKKFCAVRVSGKSSERISRFFDTEKQAKMRCDTPNDFVMEKDQCINLGIYIKPKKKSIQQRIDMSLIPGIHMTNHDDIVKANAINTKLYVDYCVNNGYIVPLMPISK